MSALSALSPRIASCHYPSLRAHWVQRAQQAALAARVQKRTVALGGQA